MIEELVEMLLFIVVVVFVVEKVIFIFVVVMLLFVVCFCYGVVNGFIFINGRVVCLVVK